MRLSVLVSLAVLLVSAPLLAGDKSKKKKRDLPKEIAVSYLKALAGDGDESARELLLGELTLTAEGFTIPNWKIKSREKGKVEEMSIAAAATAMRALDAAGAKALTEIMNLAEGGADDAMTTVTQEQANRMMAPTRKLSAKFQEDFPLFAYNARAGKEVYWNPANPWREVVGKLGEAGKYRLEFHKFHILEKSGKKTRVWPLRVLRIKTEQWDSGWKILPASDWDPDY